MASAAAIEATAISGSSPGVPHHRSPAQLASLLHLHGEGAGIYTITSARVPSLAFSLPRSPLENIRELLYIILVNYAALLFLVLAPVAWFWAILHHN